MKRMMKTMMSLAVMTMLLISLSQNVYADYGFSASTRSDYGFNGPTTSGHGFVQASSPGAGSEALNAVAASRYPGPTGKHYNPGNYYPSTWYPISTYPVNSYPYYNQYKNCAPTASVYCQHCRCVHHYGVHAPQVYNQPPANFRYYGNAGPSTGR